MQPLPISHFTVSSALGAGCAQHVDALLNECSGLKKISFDTNTLDCYLGEVNDFNAPLVNEWAAWDCRNNRLAEFGLRQDGFIEAAIRCREYYGADRVGVFIGTSTSGVQQTELAYRERDATTHSLPAWFEHRTTQNIFSIAD